MKNKKICQNQRKSWKTTKSNDKQWTSYKKKKSMENNLKKQWKAMIAMQIMKIMKTKEKQKEAITK